MSEDSGSNSYFAPQGDVYRQQWRALGGWFLGPRAENRDVFMDIFQDIFAKHVELRKNYFPSDPAYITEDIKSSDVYRSEVEDLKKQLMKMQDEMSGDVPFFSPRYQGHMNWDTTMPAILGYMGAMLFNPNNVDSAASPVTTLYEQTVGKQLCHMLGYNVEYDKDHPKKPVAWGHITCGGSIANIESLWASRNLKFVPLAVRAALNVALKSLTDPDETDLTTLTEQQVKDALQLKLIVYNSGEMVETPLTDCTTWQLLNVDVDVSCDLLESAIESVFTVNGTLTIPQEKLDKYISELKVLVEREGVMGKGLFNFLKDQSIEKLPVYTVPANNHYSWPKAGTLLGLGSDALIPIQLDNNFRQNIKHLEHKLEECLKQEIPVLSVTAVIGSTEESAVDPIEKIFDLREKFKARGLDFTILADAAWGGYFKTMLYNSPGRDKVKNEGADYVPYVPLSKYVTKQYKNVQLADTITIDPHKSGFCSYPGGGLCYRNGKMRYPIALFHPEVFHGEGDPTMGVYGIEGSKPGAAPAGILMSHNVIGLDNRGYGRILGQCTATTKLFYALWLTVARDDDPFECLPFQQLPENFKDIEKTKKMIRNNIAYKSMSEIYKIEEVREFLEEAGPDTLINSFVVNPKHNKDIGKANKLQVALADALGIFVGTDPRRVPLIIMQSGLDAKKHGKGLEKYKERLGLEEKLESKAPEDLNVMVNSCMNPWQWNESISAIGDLFRMIVLNCIGRIEDKPIREHRFIMAGSLSGKADDPSLFLEYLTRTTVPEKHYQVSVKVEVSQIPNHPDLYAKAIATLKDYVEKSNKSKKDVRFEVSISEYGDLSAAENPPNLYNILHLQDWEKKIYLKLVNYPGQPVIAFNVLDIPRYQRLDLSSEVTYPEHQKYFIYGDSTRTIMSHVMSQLPDFQHTVTLSGRPHSMTQTMLTQGVMADVVGVDGSFVHVSDEMVQPLDKSSYPIKFTGEVHSAINTSVNIEEQIFFHPIFTPEVSLSNIQLDSE